MRVHSFTGYAVLAALIGGVACAGNTARTDDADQTAAAQDTTTTQDTLGAETQNPPGYQGMERDTTLVPPSEGEATDTFLQRQGQGYPQDTAGYGGMERVDTSAQTQTDTTWGDTGAAGDTAAQGGQTWGTDTTMTDTTGYNPTQESRDTISQ